MKFAEDRGILVWRRRYISLRDIIYSASQNMIYAYGV